MIGPIRFSGRTHHESNPLPINDQPTSTTSGQLGICGRSIPASVDAQTAPTPARSPARASTPTLTFTSR